MAALEEACADSAGPCYCALSRLPRTACAEPLRRKWEHFLADSPTLRLLQLRRHMCVGVCDGLLAQHSGRLFVIVLILAVLH